jgi:hypothetical protein
MRLDGAGWSDAMPRHTEDSADATLPAPLACFVFALPLFSQNLELYYIGVEWGGAVLIFGPGG